MKQYEQVTKYKKVFKEASEEEVLKKYKTDAIKSLSKEIKEQFGDDVSRVSIEQI